MRAAARSRAGFTVIELLLAVAITSLLGLAIAAGLSASMMAYGTTSQSAAVSGDARRAVNQALAMIRTSRLHDAYDPDQPGLTLVSPGHANDPLPTVGVMMQRPDGTQIRIWWAADDAYGQAMLGDLWVQQGAATPQPLVRRVRAQGSAGSPHVFTLASRTSDEGLLLARATLEIVVEPDATNSLAIESAAGRTAPVHLIRSVVPRANLD
jgi:hypothetical protein